MPDTFDSLVLWGGIYTYDCNVVKNTLHQEPGQTGVERGQSLAQKPQSARPRAGQAIKIPGSRGSPGQYYNRANGLA